jgi:hypothetical protein
MMDILTPHADATLEAMKTLQTALAESLMNISKAVDDFRTAVASNDVGAQGAISMRMEQMAKMFNGQMQEKAP